MITFEVLNVIYSYLCHSLKTFHLEKSNKSNDCLTMKVDTDYDMIINYTLLFIFNLRYFEQILQNLEDIQGNPPDSGNSDSFP